MSLDPVDHSTPSVRRTSSCSPASKATGCRYPRRDTRTGVSYDSKAHEDSCKKEKMHQAFTPRRGRAEKNAISQVQPILRSGIITHRFSGPDSDFLGALRRGQIVECASFDTAHKILPLLGGVSENATTGILRIPHYDHAASLDDLDAISGRGEARLAPYRLRLPDLRRWHAPTTFLRQPYKVIFGANPGLTLVIITVKILRVALRFATSWTDVQTSWITAR
jgi:hypothetical protein